MKRLSQYDANVNPKFRNSACGPTAVTTLLSHYNVEADINEMYTKLGTTAIGLFVPVLIYKARKLLGQHWLITRASIGAVMQSLNNDAPILAKFDRHTSRTPWKKATFRYHWVVITKYRLVHDVLYLTALNNGKEIVIHYGDNAHALTFVSIVPR